MARIYLLDRVRVATTTGGTGALAVGAAPSGYLAPGAAGAVSGQIYTWLCESEDGLSWELFEGPYTAGAPITIGRSRIIRNDSGGTTAVNWPAGTTKRITCVGVSDRLPYLDTNGVLPNGMIPQGRFTLLQSTAARSIPHSTNTTMNWDTIGASTLGGASGTNGTYNGIVIPISGGYSLEAAILWAPNGNGGRSMSLVVNGSLALSVDQKAAAGLGQVSLQGSWKGGLNAGDVISLQLAQDSGVALAAGGTLANGLSVELL